MPKTRRQFLSSLVATVAGIGSFNILPGASRLWKATRKPLPWEDGYILPVFYRRQIAAFKPTFRDFLDQYEKDLVMPSIEEGKALLKIIEEPVIWAQNMSKTKRIAYSSTFCKEL